MTSSLKSDMNGFRYIAERDDQFLSLFPHRFDFIFAEYPDPKTSPNWQTESRYPLSDRLAQQSSYLYGVRFGSTTQYCLLDIDVGSSYHPQQDPLAIPRIQAAMESLGLITPVTCTSSDSGGLHLYFPFQLAQNSWEVATAVSAVLENAGFRLKAGQLEVFPNPKPYVAEGTPSLFNAHRLPMQIGSYLLNRDFQPIWSDRQQFLLQWQFSQLRNELDSDMLKQIVKQAKRKSYRVSGKADQFINDLNAEIEMGWTGSGQTNRLLGRITMRSYIFHHVLFGGEPLTGQALADEVARVARSLPGYEQWCRHQHEIEKKASEWARCIENSAYFPYGMERGKFKAKDRLAANQSKLESELTWNQQQSEAARARIRNAIADLLETDSLPMGATARFRALTACGIGGGSLYRHRDLWHPDYLWKTPSDSPSSNANQQGDSAEGASTLLSSTSLLSESDGNTLSGQGFSSFTVLSPIAGDNRFSDQVIGMRQVTLEMSKTTDRSREKSKEELLTEALTVQREALTTQREAIAVTMMPIDLVFDGYDLSNLLAQIAIELQWLAWTPTEVRERLRERFGKPRLDHLDDREVVEWLILLRQQEIVQLK
jgi:hypothetical protein